MDQSLETVVENSAAALRTLAATHDLDLIVVFGSLVTNRTHAKSDLDIAVHYRGAAPSAFAFDLQGALAQLFGRDIDLVVLNHADPLLFKQVIFGCEKIFGDERTLAELKLLAFKRYEDWKPRFREERDFVRRFIEIHYQ